MLHASTQKLIVKICELTDQGAIAWKEAEGEPPASRFDSEGYVVEVTADPPTVRLLRNDGRELERADAAELEATPWVGGAGTFATHVASMASRAHRVARGAEAAISRILSSLSAPPQKLVEPEPSPAAPEFDVAPSPAPAPATTRAAESEAAMASIAADMESMRRNVRPEPPPQSHSAPEPGTEPEPQPIVPEPPHAMTAPELLASTAPVALAPELEPVIEAPKAEPTAVPAPPPVTQRPVFRPDSLPLPPRPTFGATPSFGLSARSAPPKFNPNPGPPLEPETGPRIPVTPKLTPTKVTSGGLLFTGISATTHQNIRGEQVPRQDGTPAPAPMPEPPPQPRKGADIYKPWV